MAIVIIGDNFINNWSEFILYKFKDDSLYEIKEESGGDFIIRSRTNKTIIYFYFDTEKSLIDCQFFNEDCKGWSGELTTGYDNSGLFNKLNVGNLNEVLKIPINEGWLSIDYYLGDVLLQSKTYFKNEDTPFVHHQSGFFTLILYPLFLLFIILIDSNLIGKKVTTNVAPIE